MVTMTTPTLDQIEEAAKKLSHEDLRTLVARLRNSLELSDLDDDSLDDSNAAPSESPPLSQEWLDEIQRRSREIDEGLVQPVPFVDPVLRLERLRGCE